MSLANVFALYLIKSGLSSALLGSEGHDLNQPLHQRWQTAVHTSADVSTCPLHNNIGICWELQRNGLPELLTRRQAQAGEGAC